MNDEKLKKRPYKPPQLTVVLVSTGPLMLACTNQFDCSVIVGFECCAADEEGCAGC
jgi:hypothetical protein